MAAQHPQSYLAYRFEEKGGDLKPAEVQWQDPKDGQIVVKVLACGVCARYVHLLCRPPSSQIHLHPVWGLPKP